MKRSHPDLLTLLLAHMVGSYAAYIPTEVVRFLNPGLNENSGWIYLCLAPVFAPIGLAVRTVTDFPRYYNSYMPLSWACYTIPFVIVCLIRRKKTPVTRLVIPPVVMTLFVAALWLPGVMAVPVPWRSPLEKKLAPDFTLTTLTGITCSISQEKGHVVLIDFWGVSCPPCIVELKQTISKLADDAELRERGLRVWTIDNMDDADTARKFMRENHYDFNVLLGPKRVATNLYHPHGIPCTFLIARDGSIRKAFSGFGPEMDEQLRIEIDAALK